MKNIKAKGSVVENSTIETTSEEASSSSLSSPRGSDSITALTLDFIENNDFSAVMQHEAVKKALGQFNLSGENMLSIVCSKKPKLNFLISVGQSYHQQTFQESIFYLIAVIQKFRDSFPNKVEDVPEALEVEFLVAGTLQAYNTQNENLKNYDYWKACEEEWIVKSLSCAKALGFVEKGGQLTPANINITFMPWGRLKQDAQKAKIREELVNYVVENIGSDLSKTLIRKIERYVKNLLSREKNDYKKDSLFLGIKYGDHRFNWNEWSTFKDTALKDKIIEELFQKKYVDLIMKIFGSRASHYQLEKIRCDFFPCTNKDNQIQTGKEFIQFLNNLPDDNFKQLKNLKSTFKEYFTKDSGELHKFLEKALNNDGFSEEEIRFLKALEEDVWKPFSTMKYFFGEHMMGWAKQRIKGRSQGAPEDIFLMLSDVFIDLEGSLEFLDQALVNFFKKNSSVQDGLLEAFVEYNLEEASLIYGHSAKINQGYEQFLIYPSSEDPFFRSCSGFKINDIKFGSMQWIELAKEPTTCAQLIDECLALNNALSNEKNKEKVNAYLKEPNKKNKKELMSVVGAGAFVGGAGGGIGGVAITAGAGAASATPILVVMAPTSAAAAGGSGVFVVGFMTLGGALLGAGIGYCGYKLYTYFTSSVGMVRDEKKSNPDAKAGQSRASLFSSWLGSNSNNDAASDLTKKHKIA